MGRKKKPGPKPKPALMKFCSMCGNLKLATHFNMGKKHLDGLQPYCRECSNKRARATYHANPSYKQVVRRYQAANPGKTNAHKLVRKALNAGTLLKQPCIQCGNSKSEAHHDDYTKPLDVMWLCRSHHRRRHIELKAKGIDPDVPKEVTDVTGRVLTASGPAAIREECADAQRSADCADSGFDQGIWLDKPYTRVG